MGPCAQPRKEPQGADVITYNSAISACAKAGKTMLALELLQVMERQRSSPNVISYSSAPWLETKPSFVKRMWGEGLRWVDPARYLYLLPYLFI